MFKTYYSDRLLALLGKPLTPTDGLEDTAVEAALVNLGFSIPQALVDYYAIAGNHPINNTHNILRPIEELQWFGDYLIFMEENQGIAYWGIHRDDCREPNPIVWQGQNIGAVVNELEDEPLEWFAEDYRLNQFLMAMWKWTLTGEQEEVEF